MTITFADIQGAADRLAGVAVTTPLLENAALNARVGARVLIKAEMFQHVGAFKFRGAYNRLSRLSAADRARGVVAFSSGNHAQGVALAARMLGIAATIVMPADAPAVKLAATRRLGGEIRAYDRRRESREAIAEQIARERGATVVPSFDDPLVIAGQGTCGLELMDQAEALGARVDLVLGPISGGGLMAGVAMAVKARRPETDVWGVEPQGFDDTRRSLLAGERRPAPAPPVSTLCDALQSPLPGALTFPILRDRLGGVLTVTDAEVAGAMRVAFETLKLVVEPGGAVALAAVMNGAAPVRGRTVVIILSGGNVDPALFARVIGDDLPALGIDVGLEQAQAPDGRDLAAAGRRDAGARDR